MFKSKRNSRLFIGISVIVCVVLICIVFKIGDFTQNFSNLFTQESKYKNTINDDFTNEVLSIESIGGTNIQNNEDEKVVGFFVDKNQDLVLSTIKDELAKKGWSCFAVANSSSTTFTKSNGAYTWLLLNCVSVGDGTSVVFISD